MTNRLAGSHPAHLAQHADNPVDRWPRCDEAFERARLRDAPVLRSLGYGTCHRCHEVAASLRI